MLKKTKTRSTKVFPRSRNSIRSCKKSTRRNEILIPDGLCHSDTGVTIVIEKNENEKTFKTCNKILLYVFEKQNLKNKS